MPRVLRLWFVFACAIYGCESRGTTGGPGVEPPVIRPHNDWSSIKDQPSSETGEGGQGTSGTTPDAGGDGVVPDEGLLESCEQRAAHFAQDFEEIADSRSGCHQDQDCTVVRAVMECPINELQLETCAHAINTHQINDIISELDRLSANYYCITQPTDCKVVSECTWPREKAICEENQCILVFP